MSATTTQTEPKISIKAEPKISIKVVVDKNKNRVAYAEADHNFVDILFSFIAMPLGTILRLLREHDDKKFEPLGSLNNLYQSLVDLPECYFSTAECKYTLLNPRSQSYDLCRKLKLKIDTPTKYFICEESKCNEYSYCVLSNSSTTSKCRKCGKLLNREVFFKDGGSDDGGVFVSDITKYIVTDDLSVMSYTPGGCIQLLIDLGITDALHLEERTFDFGRKQILDLLRVALSLDFPLTYLVLGNTISCCEFVPAKRSKTDQASSSKKESSTNTKMYLQVSLQKSTGKLLFAEANEDFADFVFGFLPLSLGTIIGGLTNGSSSLVCIDNIFKSISNMNEEKYLKSSNLIDTLLKPHFGHPFVSKNQIFPLSPATCSTVYYTRLYTNTEGWLVTSDNQASDSDSDSYQVGRASFVDPRIKGQMFKRSGMFMVTDDLIVTPSLSVSSMDVLKKLKVSLIDIERHKVSIGLEEGLRMLKASLRSSSSLTKGLEQQLKSINNALKKEAIPKVELE